MNIEGKTLFNNNLNVHINTLHVYYYFNGIDNK